MPESLNGCSMSNQEFEIAVKLRLGCKVHPNLPDICSCGTALDPLGDHLLKCRQGNEWGTRHTAINQVMASIIRSSQLPVSTEIVWATLTSPPPGYQPPQGRMDLVVTDSDFSTILADVTITHPNPSDNQPILQSMLQPVNFSTNRENTKRSKYGQTASILGAYFIPWYLKPMVIWEQAFPPWVSFHWNYSEDRSTPAQNTKTNSKTGLNRCGWEESQFVFKRPMQGGLFPKSAERSK